MTSLDRSRSLIQMLDLYCILNSKRNAYFNYCVFCTNWVLGNIQNDIKATNDAWNMCINKCIVDNWLFGVNANKEG